MVNEHSEKQQVAGADLGIILVYQSASILCEISRYREFLMYLKHVIF